MTPQLWIGFGFLTALVIFLMVSFFFTPKLTNDQRATLKFLTALCAGMSGGFLAGDALFDMTKTVPGGKLTVGGTTGFALFLIVWFGYPKLFTIADAVSMSIPDGWTFRGAVTSLVGATSAVAEYKGFRDEELNARLRSQRIETKTVVDALLMLRLLVVTPAAIREYDVERDGPVYRFKVRG